MKEGSGGKLEKGESIIDKIKKRIDYAIKVNRKKLLRDLRNSVDEGELRGYLESPLALSQPVSDVLLFEVLDMATRVLSEEAHYRDMPSVTDDYIDVEYITLEDEMLEQEGFNELLNEAQIVRFRSMAIALASHFDKKIVHKKLRMLFLFAICRMMPEVPAELLIRLDPEYKVFVQHTKRSQGDKLFNMGRTEAAILKMRTLHKEEQERELSRMRQRGIDQRFINRYVQEEPKIEHHKFNVDEILQYYPNTDDLLADLLGTGFVNIMNSYYSAKDENGTI